MVAQALSVGKWPFSAIPHPPGVGYRTAGPLSYRLRLSSSGGGLFGRPEIFGSGALLIFPRDFPPEWGYAGSTMLGRTDSAGRREPIASIVQDRRYLFLLPEVMLR